MAYGTVNTDIVSDSSGGKLAPISSVFRNRIINGAMVIDQRNAGASVTLTASNVYNLDRWYARAATGSGSTAIQSSTAPIGFNNSLLITVGTGASSGATDNNYIAQRIEGFNLADLNWGTANAKTVTLSFWVRCSLTGTFGGAFQNASVARSYPFNYTISSANTWEQKSVTIVGDTSGTWLTTNGTGLTMTFDLGTGTTYQGTAGSWASADYRAATGDVSLFATSGATFYITGVQLEVGSSATGFEYVNYQTSLANCQRYFCSSFNIGTAPAQNIGGGMIGKGANGATAEPILTWSFPVSMRTSPTVTTYNPSAANNQWSAGSAPRVVTGTTAYVSVDNTGNAVTAGTQSYISLSATAEL